MTPAPATRTAGIVGIGYEGRTVQDLIRELVAMGVSKLIDVRLNPISRKPGLSKTALSGALDDVGIVYEHQRILGNPRSNRPGFGGLPHDLAAAKSYYRSLLANPEALDALGSIAEAGQDELVAILCFEADEYRCHRDVVVREVRRRLASS